MVKTAFRFANYMNTNSSPNTPVKVPLNTTLNAKVPLNTTLNAKVPLNTITTNNVNSNLLLNRITNFLNNSTEYSKYLDLINNHQNKNNLNSINKSILNIQESCDKIDLEINSYFINEINRNNSNIKNKVVLGKGSYGKVYNLGNKALKNQTNTYFDVYKECLVQHILSKDEKYGCTVPRIYNYKLSLNKNNYQRIKIIMNKVNLTKYETFEKFIEILANETSYSNKEKIIIFFNKIIGIVKVLQHFQDTYGFIHGDLKPDNFYVNTNMNTTFSNSLDTDIKIIDFGFSAMNNNNTNYLLVKPNYIANVDIIKCLNIENNNINHCKSGDLLYLFSFFITPCKYNLIIKKIFNSYYDEFEYIFGNLISDNNSWISINSIRNFIIQKYGNKIKYIQFAISKNSNILKRTTFDLWKSNKRDISNNILINDINNSIENFLISYEPENFMNKINQMIDYINQYSGGKKVKKRSIKKRSIKKKSVKKKNVKKI